MKLYYFPPSPNSLRVQAVANHLGIELELETVDLPNGGHLEEEFIKLNPNHKIPTLVDGDFVLWESTAIILYLAEKNTEAGLIPADLQQRIQMHQWMAWNLAHFTPQCGTFLFERIAKKLFNMGEPDENEIAKAEELFHRYAKVLDDHLQDRDWLVGNSISLADHSVGAFLIHAEPAAYPLENYNHIQRWWGNIVKLDAWKKAVEGLESF